MEQIARVTLKPRDYNLSEQRLADIASEFFGQLRALVGHGDEVDIIFPDHDYARAFVAASQGFRRV